jgi:hypothetical protein
MHAIFLRTSNPFLEIMAIIINNNGGHKGTAAIPILHHPFFGCLRVVGYYRFGISHPLLWHPPGVVPHTPPRGSVLKPNKKRQGRDFPRDLNEN